MLCPWLLCGFNGPWCLDSLPDPLSPCLGTVRRAAQSCGLKEVGDNEEWTVYWTDYSVSLERVMEMKRFQVKPLCEGCPGESSGGRDGGWEWNNTLQDGTEVFKVAPVTPAVHQFQRVQVHRPFLLLCHWYSAINNTLAVGSMNWRAANPFNVACNKWFLMTNGSVPEAAIFWGGRASGL